MKMLTLEEMVAENEKELAAKKARPRWGPWRLDRKHACLVVKVPGTRSDYDITLSDCTCSAEILDWIAQIRAKNWATPAMVGHLVDAFDWLFDLQGSVCGMGKDHQIKPLAHLKKRGWL